MKRTLAFPLLVALVAALSSPASSPAAVASPAGSESAGRTVASCLQRSNHLLVDLEIDRSGSLRGTDPEDRRVDGVGAALLGLARLAEGDDAGAGSPHVEVLLSSFAGTVGPHHLGQHWRRLDRGSVDSLLRAAEGYGKRDHGRDTDYALALSAANRALNQRARAVYDGEGAPPCKALVFLSDGKFHIGDRTGKTSLPSRVPYAPGVDLGQPGGGKQAVKAGKRYLCAAGGLRDRMVSSGIVMFTVALSASQEFTLGDRDALEALTTGEGGDCGSTLSTRTGQFVEARNSYDLFFIFAGLVLPPGPDIGCWLHRKCPNPSQFTTFPGLRGFSLSASAPRRGVELQLTAPGGEQTVLSSGGPRNQDLGGTEVRQHWIQARSMELQVLFPPDSEAWVGTWRFRFFAPNVSTPVPIYDLNLQSDLRPEIFGETQLARGEKGIIHLRLVDSTGHAVTSGKLVGAARLHAEVRDGGGDSHPVTVREGKPGRFTLSVEVPREIPDGNWALSGAVSYPGVATPIETQLFDLGLPDPASGKGPDTWLLIAIGAGILLVLVLGAFGFSYWRRLADARFTPPQVLRAFRNEAVVTPEGDLELVPPLGPLGLRYDDFHHLKRSGRDTKAGKLVEAPFELVAKVPWRLRGRPQGIATAGGRKLLAGGKDRTFRSADGDLSVEVPLDLAGTWLFATGPVDERGRLTGELAIFTDDDSPHDLGQEVLEAARAALREQDWEEFVPPEQGRDDDVGWDDFESETDVEGIDWESI